MPSKITQEEQVFQRASYSLPNRGQVSDAKAVLGDCRKGWQADQCLNLPNFLLFDKMLCDNIIDTLGKGFLYCVKSYSAGEVGEERYFYVNHESFLVKKRACTVYPAFPIGEDNKIDTTKRFILKKIKKVKGRFYSEHEASIQSHYFETAADSNSEFICIFTEYIPGKAIIYENIEELCFIQRIDLIIGLCRELVRFHDPDSAAGALVHSDIKGENARFYIEEGQVRLRIFDFGLSAWLDDMTSAFLSTLYSVPPEFINRYRTTASDIYALVYVIAEILGELTPYLYKREVSRGVYKEFSRTELCRAESYLPYCLTSLFPANMKELPSESIRQSIFDKLNEMSSYDPSKRPSASECLDFFKRKKAEFILQKDSQHIDGDDERPIVRRVHNIPDDVKKKLDLVRFYLVIKSLWSYKNACVQFEVQFSNALLRICNDPESRKVFVNFILSEKDAAEQALFKDTFGSYMKSKLESRGVGSHADICRQYANNNFSADVANKVTAIRRLLKAERKYRTRLFTPYMLEAVMDDDPRFRSSIADQNANVFALAFLQLPASYQLNILSRSQALYADSTLLPDLIKALASDYDKMDPRVLKKLDLVRMNSGDELTESGGVAAAASP